MSKNELKLYVNEVQGGEIRREEKGGNEYLVAPMTFIKSMRLHRGYVPEREIEKATEKWTKTSAIAGHPNSGDEFVSLNHPDAEKTEFGFVKNPETVEDDTKKTAGELWVNVDKAEELGGDPEKIKNRLERGKTVSVSSAYGGTRLPPGEYDGKQRDKVVGNLRPDHVALLLDGGARCSVGDGCMAGPNAVSANENIGVMVNAIADDSVSPKPGQDEATGAMDGKSYNALSEARKPEFSGTTTGSWSSPTFSDYVSAFGWDAEQVDDLSSSQRTQIAEHTLLGDPDADTFDGLQVFPVVDPGSSDLSENALVAVLGGRGAQADVPESALESARTVSRTLLEDEFGRELSSNAGFIVKLAKALGVGGIVSGNESAESDESDSDNMTERTEKLVELGFNAEELPDEETDAFERIYDEFAGNEEEEPSDEETEESEQTEETDEEQDEPAVTFETEEEFEEAVGEVVEDAVDEALAANEKRQEKAEIADEIIANSDDHDEDDRETLMESPKSVLQTLRESVSEPEPTPDYAASRGVSANRDDGSGDMPALSASERIKEKESDD